MAKSKDTPVILSADMRRILEEGGAIHARVRLDQIVLASHRGGPSGGVFQNLRQKCDAERLQQLSDSIATLGLLHPPAVRQIEGGDGKKVFQIIAGERRTRAIMDLVKSDRPVLNGDTGKEGPASEVYKTVPCRVMGKCDERSATRIAYNENNEHEPLTDAEVIDLCRDLALPISEGGWGMTRKEIGEHLRRSPAWLSHTYAFETNLTPENYRKLRSGEISRSVAISLMDFVPEKQVPVIAAATQIATERRDSEVALALQEEREADGAVQKAFREQVSARRFNADPAVLADKDRKVDQLEKVLEKTAARRRRVEESNKAVTVSQSDVAEGAFRVGIDPGNKSLTPVQIREHYVDKVKDLMGVPGNLMDKDTGSIFLRRDLDLVIRVAQAICGGNRDPLALLRKFYKDSGTWDKNGGITVKFAKPSEVAPLGEEEDLDDEEDPDDEEETFEDLLGGGLDDDAPAAGLAAGIDLDEYDEEE